MIRDRDLPNSCRQGFCLRHPNTASVYSSLNVTHRHIYLFKMSGGLKQDESKLVFESSEAIRVVSTFDELHLKEDLLRGIYAYSAFLIFTLQWLGLFLLIIIAMTP